MSEPTDVSPAMPGQLPGQLPGPAARSGPRARPDLDACPDLDADPALVAGVLDPAVIDCGRIDADWDAAQHQWDPEHDSDDLTDGAGGLPADVRAAFWAAPWTGEGEAWAAGFLHREDGPRGYGFAADGDLDRLVPGPLLAQYAALATASGHAQLGESELIGVLCAWQRLADWAVAGTAAAVTTLDRRRHAQAREREHKHLAEHVADEVAAALTLTGRAARMLVDDAAGLARLPEVHAALAQGRIDWRRAVIFPAELANIGDHAAAGLAAQVLPGADRMTTAQIQRALRRLVLDHDPEAAVRRKDDAAQGADVHAWAEPSGNAGLAGRELPEADVLLADRRLTAMARWLAERGASGSLGQLRAAVFLAQLNGRPVTSLLPGTPDGAAAAAAVEPGSPLAGPYPGAAGPDVTGTIHLTLPLSTWAGLADKSGEVAGYGPADSATCRDLVARLSAHPATRWCLTLTGQAGQALAHACAPAGRRGYGPAPPGRAALGWAAGLASRLTWLETGTCSHARQEHRYQPSPSLAHLIRIRQPRCGFPGCGCPARRADLDHTVPYDKGGITCECNLAPMSRGHHRAKQAPGWHLDQPTPGVMIWRTPSGRTYQLFTDGYPA